MTGVIKRDRFIFENEALRSAAGLDDILSKVLDATTVNTSFSGVPGRYIVPQGAVMVFVDPSDSDSKIAPAFMNNGQGSNFATLGTNSGAYQAGDVCGILSRTIELIVGDAGPDSTSDCDASVWHFGNDFNINKLYGYGGTGNPSASVVKAALPHCLFR